MKTLYVVLGGNNYYMDTLLKWIRYVWQQLLDRGCIVVPVEVDQGPMLVIGNSELSYFPENEGEVFELLLTACNRD